MSKDAVLDMTEAAIDATEAALDNVEKAIDGVSYVKSQHVTALIMTAVVSAAVGGGVSYYLTRRHLKAKYEKVIGEELEEAKKFYKQLHKTDEYSTPEELAKKYSDESDLDEKDVQEAVEALQTYQGVDVKQGDRYHPSVVEKPSKTEEALVEETKVEVKKTRNIFAEAKIDEDFDEEEHIRTRDTSKPYLITFDEFFTNEDEYEELNLTYYEEDDVLADERDQHIDDTEGLVGNANLLRFGQGSKDKNVVYIRNDQRKVIAEICRSGGSYVKEVLGFIEHSADSGRLRRFRQDDDG